MPLLARWTAAGFGLYGAIRSGEELPAVTLGRRGVPAWREGRWNTAVELAENGRNRGLMEAERGLDGAGACRCRACGLKAPGGAAETRWAGLGGVRAELHVGSAKEEIQSGTGAGHGL